MSRIRGLSILVVLGVATAVLTGCEPTGEPVAKPSPTAVTPTPSATAEPDAAKPLLEELFLTTEGLGELEFGATPPSDNPAVNLVAYDSDACEAEGLPGLWLSTYPNIDEGFGPQAPFSVLVQGDALTRIDVHSSEIYTDSGIHIGSSIDEVLGVYSGGPDEVVNHADVSDVYVIHGTKGKLQFEVAVDRIPDYWEPSAINTVVFLSAIDMFTDSYGVAASDNVVGVCNIS